MLRRLLAGLALALAVVSPVAAAAPSISIDQPGPYVVGDVVTLTVEVPKLKGYEYPVVLEWCGFNPDGTRHYIYFRRWDDKYPPESGPEPVLLTTSGECTFELWAYSGRHGNREHVLAVAPSISVT